MGNPSTITAMMRPIAAGSALARKVISRSWKPPGVAKARRLSRMPVAKQRRFIAEMDPAEKNRISHRADAFRKLMACLEGEKP